MPHSQSDTPDYQNADYSGRLREQWMLVEAELGGTRTMQEGGYLPQFPAEHDEVYADRLASAVFDNDYADTLDGIVGMIFRRPVQIGDSVPARIKADLEDVDLAGTHFDVFAPRLVRKGIHYGAAYIVVDMQRIDADSPLDDAQAAAMNLRPYWITYTESQVQNRPRYVTINGAKVLQQIVFRECVSEPDGAFGEAEVIRYRVWRLPVMQTGAGQFIQSMPAGVEWEVWEEREQEKASFGEQVSAVILIDSGFIPGLTRLPISPFIANPDIYDETQCDGPTLYDLAELCKKDWWQQSDHDSNLHLCSSPIPFTVGLRDDGAHVKQAWGKGIRYDCEEGGSVGYAEPAGTALQAMERQLASNKDKIRQKGLEMVLEGGAPNTTATEQLLRAGKRASRLSMITQAAHDCLENALQISAQWYGLGDDAGGEITMGVRGDELILTASDIQALSAQAAKEQISLRTLWAIQMRGGILGDDFDADAELAEIANQKRMMAVQDAANAKTMQDALNPQPQDQPAPIN